jgi:hypothetical protein
VLTADGADGVAWEAPAGGGGGDVLDYGSSDGTSTLSTSSTAPQTALSVSITVAEDALVRVAACCRLYSGGTNAAVMRLYDGNTASPIMKTKHTTPEIAAMSWDFELTAGTHTLELQYYIEVSGDSAYMRDRMLVAVALPR